MRREGAVGDMLEKAHTAAQLAHPSQGEHLHQDRHATPQQPGDGKIPQAGEEPGKGVKCRRPGERHSKEPAEYEVPGEHPLNEELGAPNPERQVSNEGDQL